VLTQTAARVFNGIRKVLAGLRPFNESVWPGAATDLFVAHRSIYSFAARYCAGKDVLDAGCGTGYGSSDLLAAGAKSVIGVDLDSRSIRFARRRYRDPRLTFHLSDLEKLSVPCSRVDVIVSSNALEHLDEPQLFLRHAARLLAPDGVLLVAVPPIRDESERRAHDEIHYHRSLLDVTQWADLLTAEGFEVDVFLHRVRDPATTVDVHSHFKSRLTVADFVFEPATIERLVAEPTITAIFVARVQRATARR
jgi:SAM-dependent methyltransferase